MGLSDNLTAANTKDILAQSKATNQKLDAIVAELKTMNAWLAHLASQQAPAH